MIFEPDFSTSGNIGKRGHKNVVHFTDDAAPSITLLMCNKRSPRFQRRQVVVEQIPLEARREYWEKRHEWAEDADYREAVVAQDEEDRKARAIAAMKRSIAR